MFLFIVYLIIQILSNTLLYKTQLPGSDYIEVNDFGVIGEYLLLLLFALAAIYSMVAILLKLIRLFIRSKKKHIFASYRLAVNLSVVLSLAVFIYITLNLFSSTPMYAKLQWSIYLMLYVLSYRLLICFT